MSAPAVEAVRSTSFADLLGEHGARPALLQDEQLVTYEDLDRLVAEIGDQLGTTRRLVAIEAAPTVASVVAYLAALRHRHPILLLPGDRHTGSAVLDTYQPDVVVDSSSRWQVREQRAGTAHDLHPDLALLLSTSGSTGSAKLVRLSLAGLQANATSISSYLRLTPDDRAITTLPLHYCYGLSVLNSHLTAGASLVLNELSVVDRCFWERMRTCSVTSFAGVPYTFEMLDKVGFDEMSLPSLRYVTQAGGRMHPARVRRYAHVAQRDGWELFVMYGQTEATARMAYLPPELAATRPEAIGVAIPGGELSIDPVDEGDGGVGELVYRGPNVMLGYATTTSDLACGRDVEVLRTGDLGRRAPDGLFEITGRRSRVVKPFGIRVELDHLEQVLERHGVIAACAGGDDLLAVAVTGRSDVDAVAATAAAHVGIPRRHVTAIALDELPRLPSGKPDYAAIGSAAAAARTRTVSETQLSADPVRAAYEQVLGRPVGSDDTFVSAGGDSLSYVELSVRLEQLLGTLPTSWHLQPVRDLRPTPHRSRVRSVDITVPLRALAIVLVVGSHAKAFHLLGGAHLMMAIAGYNFGRFQRSSQAAWRTARRIALPAMCWLAVVVALGDEYNVVNLLLGTSVLNRPSDLWAYWFVEALVQILLVAGVVFAIPAVRSAEARWPFGVAFAACAAALLIRFDVVVIGRQDHPIERSHLVVWLFTLGWAAAVASTSNARRLAVSALLLLAVPGFFGQPQREALVVCGVLAVIWIPSVALVDPLPRLLGVVASASLWIYLSHWQVFPVVSRASGPAVATAASIAAGLLLWWSERFVRAGARSLANRADWSTGVAHPSAHVPSARRAGRVDARWS